MVKRKVKGKDYFSLIFDTLRTFLFAWFVTVVGILLLPKVADLGKPVVTFLFAVSTPFSVMWIISKNLKGLMDRINRGDV